MHLLFAVYDAKAELFLAPFTAPNAAVAVRWFQTFVLDKDHEFCKFAEDYTLFELGSYDPKIGKLESLPTPKSIVVALMLRKQDE